MLFFRGPDWDEGLSSGELQQAMNRVMAWFDGLQQAGKVKGGQPLARVGRTISGERGVTIADGPFAESKEAVGGYLILEADSLEEAVGIASSCPTLKLGITIEVRPILAECPCFERAKQRLAVA